MASQLNWFKVNWNWERLDETQRVLVSRYEARLQSDPSTVTSDGIIDLLTEASEQLPGIEIHAWIESTDGEETLIIANRGFANLIDPGEDGRLDPIFDELAEAEPDELFPVELRARDFDAAGIREIARAHFYPESTLVEIKEEAAQLDEPLSAVIYAAWTSARHRLEQMDTNRAIERAKVEFANVTGKPRRQTVHFPVDLFEELESMSAKLDCSQSLLLGLAWTMRQAEA